jgi:hypothetical protein
MSKPFEKAVRTIFSFYFVTIVFAVPYFNWRYANEHGFMSWIFFGEVIATAKSLVWPYFAFTGSGTASGPDAHFTNSKRSAEEALTILNRFDLGRLPAKEGADVLRLLQEAVAEAELVKDSYLQVHPEYARRYKEDYIGALRHLGEGIRENNATKQVLAAKKYNDFSDWVSSHRNEFRE